MQTITAADFGAGRMRGWNFINAGQAVDGPPSQQDYRDMAATGANHARVWLDATWSGESYAVQDAHLQSINACLIALESVGMYAVIVLSINAAQQPWGDAQKAQALGRLWASLAALFLNRPVVAAVDLLNEPYPTEGPALPGQFTDEQFARIKREWRDVASLCVPMIRAVAPACVVVYEVGLGADPGHFSGEPLPFDGIVYSTHVYIPHSVTHQGTVEWNAGDKSFPVPLSYDAAAKAALYRDALDKIAAGFPGLPKYVGEFGCANWVPGFDDYLADVAGWCVDHSVSYAAHAFRQWPGWNYEAVPDGRSDFVNSQTTPAILALRAEFARQLEMAPVQKMTQEQWNAADIAARRESFRLWTNELTERSKDRQERVERRQFDERRLIVERTNAESQAALAAAIKDQTAAVKAVKLMPEPLAKEATLASLVAAQLASGKSANVSAAAGLMTSIKTASAKLA